MIVGHEYPKHIWTNILFRGGFATLKLRDFALDTFTEVASRPLWVKSGLSSQHHSTTASPDSGRVSVLGGSEIYEDTS